MNLKLYLRNKIRKHFNSLVKKNKCEYCGSTENLEVHHLYHFIKMLEDTLKELNLELKDTEEYTSIELLNITEKILGKHLKYNYKTLCNSCHMMEYHNRRERRTEFSFEIDGEIFLDDVKEIKVPIKLLDKWLYKEEIENYLIENNFKDSSCRQLTVNKFLNIIKNYGYATESKRRRIDGKLITLYKITINN